MTTAGATCVHCVVARVADRFSRRRPLRVAVWSGSLRPPRIAMSGRRLYPLVYGVLRDLARDVGDGASVRLRLLDDAHPEVEILACACGARGVRMRSVRVPRHADDSLAGGFAESVPG